MSEIAGTAVVSPDTVVGADVTVEDAAVVGKHPSFGKQSTAARAHLIPLQIGDGSSILAGAVVFAGTTLGRGVIVGDQACVRERCRIGDCGPGRRRVP